MVFDNILIFITQAFGMELLRKRDNPEYKVLSFIVQWLLFFKQDESCAINYFDKCCACIRCSWSNNLMHWKKSIKLLKFTCFL